MHKNDGRTASSRTFSDEGPYLSVMGWCKVTGRKARGQREDGGNRKAVDIPLNALTTFSTPEVLVMVGERG